MQKNLDTENNAVSRYHTEVGFILFPANFTFFKKANKSRCALVRMRSFIYAYLTGK